MSSKSKINLKTNNKKFIINADIEQLNRVFINLIKNSEESFLDSLLKNPNFKGKIDIELKNNDTYIDFVIIDNGVGFGIFANNIKDILNPYFTTKKKGTGLGLAIVNKIINDHNGKINFIPIDDGAKIQVVFIR